VGDDTCVTLNLHPVLAVLILLETLEAVPRSLALLLVVMLTL
jgi:hypothetical protein